MAYGYSSYMGGSPFPQPGPASPNMMMGPPNFTSPYAAGAGAGQSFIPQQGGGFLGAFGRYMKDPENQFMLLSAAGGLAEALERRAARKDEQRRYEEQMEESRRHRMNMGRSLGGVWG